MTIFQSVLFLIFCFVFWMTLVSRKNNFSSLENHWWLKQLLLFQRRLFWPRSLGRTSSSTANRETRQGRMVRNWSEHPEMAENFISYVRQCCTVWKIKYLLSFEKYFVETTFKLNLHWKCWFDGIFAAFNRESEFLTFPYCVHLQWTLEQQCLQLQKLLRREKNVCKMAGIY